ncbi:hypothetical protein [Paenibacillus ferrarius]|uniref:hypothetical protein n=1 Tax=Paenibacillus ferrarius TaxID=1469647 RepID=UPI003D2BFF9A
MGTRLRSEQLVKARFPHLRYIRIHTSSKHKATIYAWTDELELSKQDHLRLEKYANAYLYPYTTFLVKAYGELRADQVPLLPELPNVVTQAALKKSLNQIQILEAINSLYPYGQLTFKRYDEAESIIYFTYQGLYPLDDAEKMTMHAYLTELIPLGCYGHVAYEHFLSER